MFSVSRRDNREDSLRAPAEHIRENNSDLTMTLAFTAGCSFLSKQLGRLDLFAQRKIVSGARYGFIGEDVGILDLPGCSVAFAVAAKR